MSVIDVHVRCATRSLDSFDRGMAATVTLADRSLVDVSPGRPPARTRRRV